MKIQNKILIAIALSVCSQPVLSVPFTFEGRSLGMGGVSTATADLATAAWANPAMLTNQRPDDDFSLLIGVGAFARDNENLRDDIDAFQAADSRRKNTADPVEQAQALQEMADIVSGIGNKDVAGDVSGVLAVGMAFREYAMALSIRADAVGAGTVEDLSTAPADLIDPNSGANMLTLEGVIATEFGFSIAKRFDLSGSSLSVGLKPKAVDLQSYIFRESINTVDSGENVLDQGLKSDLGTFASLDMGVAYDFDRSFRLGLNVRNIVTDEFQLPNGQILNFETTARIGAAYFNRFLTVAVDYDVTENKPLLANPGFDDLKTQYLSVGAEFNAFDFAQLRVGARKNLAGGITESAKDTALTAGIGFWLGFNLDVAATFADNTVGGFVQTGFRF
ncbi:MAG: conjugal transfer protein TraF [Gammaproteobacteria bacterium]|nr:conjugal transfer protein TraF [Gammaproteobacteria bacterium]